MSVDEYIEEGKEKFDRTDYLGAIESFTEAIGLLGEDVDNKTVSEIYNLIALAYYYEHKPLEAIENFKKAIEFSEHQDIDVIEENIKNAEEHLIKLDVALKESMEKLNKIEDDIEKAVMYTNIANLLFFKGERESSSDYFLKSAQIFEIKADDIALAASYNNLGRLYNDVSAIDYFYKALELLEKENHLKGIIDTYYALSKFYWKSSNDKEAFHFLQKSIGCIDKLMIDSKNKRELFARYQDIYRLAADVALNIGKEEEAMKITEHITDLEKG